MQEQIDFLPDRYRERVLVRRAVLWQGLLLIGFGCAIGGTAAWQLMQRNFVQRELAAIESEHGVALSSSARYEARSAELHMAQEHVALVAYLRHPWPKSQLLFHATKDLPESIHLLTLRIDAEDDRSTADTFAGPSLFVSKDEEKEEVLPPLARDLSELRLENDMRRPVLHITGIATNTTDLHVYVAELDAAPLFRSAKLESLEAITGDEQAGRSRFELRLHVRPGYGQPGGPQLPSVAAQPVPAGGSS